VTDLARTAVIRNGIMGITLLACVLPAAANPTPVTTRTLSELAFFPVRDAPATAISLNDTRVSAELGGVLSEIKVRVGDSVQAGEVIAAMDCRDYTIAEREAAAALKAGQAQRTYDKSQHEKAERLSTQGSISREELDRRHSQAQRSSADVERLNAGLQAANRSIEKCALTAPFNAVVVERIASTGDYLVPGTPVLRLLDRGNIEVEARVQEQELASLQNTDDIVFLVGGKRYPLQVRTVVPMVESRLRSYTVRLEFVAEATVPGSAGRVQWTLPVAHIPPEYLVRRDSALGVFIAADGRARFLPLQGAAEGQPAVLQGEPGNALIIVDGRFGMDDGDQVRIVER
jgi:RND family efflux transporter MFP subunit